jgi:hypothetical protein
VVCRRVIWLWERACARGRPIERRRRLCKQCARWRSMIRCRCRRVVCRRKVIRLWGRLRSGETNRTAEEIRPATSGVTLLTMQGSTVRCSTLSMTLGNGPSLARLATAAGPGSSTHSSDPSPPRSSTNHPMAPTASAMSQSHPRLHPPH